MTNDPLSTTALSSLSPDVLVMARTAYGEARGGGALPMGDVCWVVRNRAANPHGWGHDIPSVCQAPHQFSCWNPSDPNRAKLLAATLDDPAFATAVRVAQGVLDGSIPDRTGGADSYYAVSMRTPPYWTAHAKHTVTLWLHSFWKTVLPNPISGDQIPTVSAQADDADALMAAEMVALGISDGAKA